MIPLPNTYVVICDNQDYVNKLLYLFEDEYHHQILYENTEQEVLDLILKILPNNVSIEQVKGHQDEGRNNKNILVKRS